MKMRLLAFFNLLLLIGCTAAPPPPKYDFDSVREQFLLRYAQGCAEVDDLNRALYYLDFITEPHTQGFEELRQSFRTRLDADDAAIAAQYKAIVKVTVNNIRIVPLSPNEFYLFGKCNLPRNTRFDLEVVNRTTGMTLTRRHDQEGAVITRGGRFSAFVTKPTDRADAPTWLPGEYQLCLRACFSVDWQQSISAQELVGKGGERLTGPLVIRDPIAGNCLVYQHNFRITKLASEDRYQLIELPSE
ncbi:MAG: hypothetical protein AB1489_21310 [Acidobacteriota bacterium]